MIRSYKGESYMGYHIFSLDRFSSPFDTAPYPLMKIIRHGRIKITYDHKAKCNIDFARKKIDGSKIKYDNDDAIGDRFDDRSFLRGS